MEKGDLYTILEVPETASMEDIKKSYRRLSLKYHPDRNPDGKETFQTINDAYDTLGDIDKKNEYDAMRKNPFLRMAQGGGGGGGGMPPGLDELLANLFFGGGGQQQNVDHNFFSGIQQQQQQQQGMMHPGMPGMMHPGMMFMGQQGGNPNIRIFRNGSPVIIQKPQAIHKDLIITMETVLTGASIPVEIERWIIENNNKVFELQTIYVTIPKGIDNNEIILLENQGNVQTSTCKGDVKIFIKIENNSEFQRKGLDLIYDKTISLKESLCGFSFELKYINNKIYTINNKLGNLIPPEYLKVIPDMGLTRDGHTGNLIIHFILEFPKSLSEEQIAVLNKIL
jgi:DnaJ-class molecular chaperone